MSYLSTRLERSNGEGYGTSDSFPPGGPPDSVDNSSSNYPPTNFRSNQSVYELVVPNNPYGNTDHMSGQSTIDDVPYIKGIKDKILMLKHSDVDSTLRALDEADRAFDNGTRTLETLLRQGDRLDNTHRSLEEADNANEDATMSLEELKRAEKMFPSIPNPFTAMARRGGPSTKMLRTRQGIRSRVEIHDESDAGKVTTVHPSAQFKFESDSDDLEDDRLENEIKYNLEAIGTVAGKLKTLAALQGEEMKRQHESLLETGYRASDVHKRLESNQAVLRRRYR
jgi:hypothetical protein